MNDIKIKELKIKYNNKFILSEIRRYVMKHIQWLNDVLIDIERVDCIIFEKNLNSAAKSLKLSNSFVTLRNDIQTRQKSSNFWSYSFLKTSLTFANLLKFVSFIESSWLISFLLLNSFMCFWKRMFHSFENSLNKKSWTFWRSFLSIRSFLFSLIMKMTLSFAINASLEDWKKF